MAAELIIKKELTLEDYKELFIKEYGITNVEYNDIIDFSNQLFEIMNTIDFTNDTNDAKSIESVIDWGNKVPAYCSFAVIEYFCGMEGNFDRLFQLLLKINKYYDEMNEKDSNSTKTSDSFETLACLLLFLPPKATRIFVKTNFEIIFSFATKFIKRPDAIITLLVATSELFLMNKESKYLDLIIKIFNNALELLVNKNNLLPEIADVTNSTLPKIKLIIKNFIEMGTKKESLRKVAGIISDKTDVGQLFYHFIILSPSCAGKIIANETFPITIIEKAIKQLKVQHVIEVAINLNNKIPADKYKVIQDYILENYNLQTLDEYLNKITSLTTKRNDSYKYGMLLRYITFMPVVYKSNMIEGIELLINKLSTIANNLTADISNRSLSITVVPMSKVSIYEEIIAQIEGEQNNISSNNDSHLAKLKNNDIVKKIKESGVSMLIFDQVSGKNIILIGVCILEILKLGITDIKQVIVEAYKLLVTKYNILCTKEEFQRIADIYFSKVSIIADNEGEIDDEDEDDDYEDNDEDGESSGDEIVDENDSNDEDNLEPIEVVEKNKDN